MKIWPRSLRMRLILVLTLAMLVTQAVVILAVAQVFGREQRIERAQQIARFMSFIKPRVEAMGDVKLDEPLNLRPTRTRMPPPDMSLKDGRPREEQFRDGKSRSDLARDEKPREMQPRPPAEGGPPPKDGPGVPPPERMRGEGGPVRDRVAITVTATPPESPGDAELLGILQSAVPEAVAIDYEDKTPWPQVGPNRAYVVTAWVRLGPDRYLKAHMDESRVTALRSESGAFASFDIALRISVGIALALLITGWIAKPLTELANSADATLPNGDLKPGAKRLSMNEVPTEIANTLAAIERMRLRIGSMVQERTTMLTALAHDLRTPITRLMLRLELAKDEKLRDEAYRDCEKMQALITRTLDFIRSTETGTMGAATNVDLNAVVMQVVAGLMPADQKRIAFADIAVDGLPQVSGNALGIERAVANVVENALKYSPLTTTVDISFTQFRSGVVGVVVADRGPGVAPELLHRLREPFFRVDVARNMDEGGAGLGLSIVDNLIRAYGGEVDIANRDGGGLVVSIKLPAV